MNIAQKAIMRRYAVAYVTVFEHELHKDDVASVTRAIPFFRRHAQALYFLTLPTITNEQKIAIMADVMKKLQMPGSLIRLLDLLIHHKRSSFWCGTLEAVVSYYYDKHQIAQAVVESFPELSDEQKKDIEQSFKRLLAKDVLYTYQVCPDLIAGLCIKTDNLMWEDSLAKKLRAVRSAVLEPYKG